MAKTKIPYREHKTKPFRVAFPELFELKLGRNGKMECTATALWAPGTDLSELEGVIDASFKDMWPKVRPPKAFNPLKDQAEFGGFDKQKGEFRLYAGAQPGGKWMRLKTREVPDIVDLKGEPVTDPARIYAGCWMRAKLLFYPYDGDESCGVSSFIASMQLIGDGERLVGKRDASDDYDVVTDEQAAQICAGSHF